MPFFSMKKKHTLRMEMEPSDPEYTPATMEFLRTMMKTQTPVTVRVEPPGYSIHKFVLPASDLRSQHFESLMPNTAVEYGSHGRIVFAITCKLEDFVHAMVDTVIRAPFSPPVGAEAARLKKRSSPRRTLGWFLARKH